MALAAREPGPRPRAGPVGRDAPSRSAPRSLPYRRFAMVMDRVDDERLDRLNAWFFRTRYPPAIAEPIIAGGFWSHGGAQALRALVGERFIPRLAAYPGPTPDPQRRVRRRLPAVGAGAFAAAARDARRVRLAGALAPRQPRPPGRVQRGGPALRAVRSADAG